jgi:carboxymethylenebutenolidase
MTPSDRPADEGGGGRAYTAVPVPTRDRLGPWPGVVVVHDVFGLGDDMREQADWLAAAGYLATVPDLFGGRRALGCIRGAFRQLTAQQGPIFDEVERARVALAGSSECTGTVGVIGYCMGGGFALVLAGRPGWGAASVNYGMVPENVEDILAGACPIVAGYGGKDRSLPGAAAALSAAATATGATVDVKEYPDARHAFLNRLAVTSPLTPLMKVSGVGYDHAAAADAKRRILAFFDQYLR